MAKNNSLSLAQEKLSLTILYSVGISKFVEKRPNTFVSLCSLTSERTTCLFPPTHARRLCEQHVSLAVCAAAQQRAVSGRGFRLQQAECPGAFASAASLTRPTPDYELASWMSAPCRVFFSRSSYMHSQMTPTRNSSFSSSTTRPKRVSQGLVVLSFVVLAVNVVQVSISELHSWQANCWLSLGSTPRLSFRAMIRGLWLLAIYAMPATILNSETDLERRLVQGLWVRCTIALCSLWLLYPWHALQRKPDR
jgi:hypothetical protein